MFGHYNIPFNIEQGDIYLNVELSEDTIKYKRKLYDEIVEKMLFINNAKFIISPVKPIHKPKKLTSYLLIEFEKPIVIEPRTKKKIYVKYPIEIGVFISWGKRLEMIDIFTIAKPKLTLYGDHINGIICKYYKSQVTVTRPSVDLLYEGILELTIHNRDSDWLEVNKSVFNTFDMKIHYNNNMAAASAEMKLFSELNAETDFLDPPIEKGMTKAIDIDSNKKLQFTTEKFVMREGL